MDDDDSCVLNYIEIVPLDNSAQQFENIKPFEVKVCIATKLNKVELLLCLLKTHVNPDIISVVKCGKYSNSRGSLLHQKCLHLSFVD